MSTPSEDLTATSYAMLGLLALKPWTTYELAKQMQRSIRWFWPRAERKLYDEPKRLASLGLATGRTEMTGRRAGTVYEITPAGRAALERWVRTGDFEPPALEIEGMVRLFFAEHGTPDDLVAALRRMAAQSASAVDELATQAVMAVDHADEFMERRAVNTVAMELFVRLHETVGEWATWAEREVRSWPPVHRRRRLVAAGPPERGTELLRAIAARRGGERG